MKFGLWPDGQRNAALTLQPLRKEDIEWASYLKNNLSLHTDKLRQRLEGYILPGSPSGANLRDVMN
jgi:hypothetical protein